MGRIAALALIILGLLGIVWVTESSLPSSSPGVEVIAPDVARLPAGDTLVFSHQSGKAHYIWKVTYLGNEVRFDESGSLFDQHKVTALPSPGTTTGQYMGDFQGTFWLTPEPGGWVRVHWPFGWDIRR